jgi:D-glycero-D-manno-heptose 1,7-bisphosphate phosphatase
MIKGYSPHPTIFLDRDGTINRDVDYLGSLDELEVFDFTREALSLCKQNGYLTIVLSNQSGIGRGLFTTEKVHEIHNAINEQVGGLIDAFYFCPHLPDDNCECRKPALGLIRSALDEYSIDVSNSWMIGDKKSDIEMGFNAGIATALVMTGYGKAALPTLERMPDLVASDLLMAARDICERDS